MPFKFNKNRWIKTVQFLAAYLVAAWTFLQFVDWTLNRYDISPYWVDVLLWIFIGIIPSLLIYLYHQERINKRILKLREKIIIPLNIVFLAIGLYFGFGNSDLGATTKEIEFTNNSGQTERKTITKEEFRIGIPIYTFENSDKNDSINWMRFGISRLLYEDLLQNKSLSPIFMYLTKTSTKIKEASVFYDFYVDGNYKKNGENYEITTYIRKSTNAKILKEQTFIGTDFLSLLDDISVFITEQSGYVETKKLKYLDFPISEFISNSEDAIREFTNGNYSKATAIDSTFALAYLQDAKRSLRYNLGTLETQDIVDKAFSNRRKLPLQKQLEVNIQRNLAYGVYDKAEEQVKLQLEVDPNNAFYNQVLFSIYGETRQTNKFLETSQRLFNNDPNADTGTNLAVAAMVTGDDDRLITQIEKYEIINQNISAFKLQPLLFQGRIDEASDLLEDIKTLSPNQKNKWQVYDTVVGYLKQHKFDLSLLNQFAGHYRSNYNEQTYDLWVENNRIIQYVKNQGMNAFVLAGENSIASGFINNRTWKYDLIKNETGTPIALKIFQYDYKNTSEVWYWKEDNSIINAHDALDKGNLDKAIDLYDIAITNNPDHAYLKNNLAQLKHKKNIGLDSLVNQHKRFEGSYGPREFWLENGKFYYKRKGENSNLPRVELLALDINRYMDLTRPNTIMKFVKDLSGKMASYSVQYVLKEKKWVESEKVSNGVINYFLKDD